MYAERKNFFVNKILFCCDIALLSFCVSVSELTKIVNKITVKVIVLVLEGIYPQDVLVLILAFSDMNQLKWLLKTWSLLRHAPLFGLDPTQVIVR